MRALPSTFSAPQRLLHWAMLALLAFNLVFSRAMAGNGIDLGYVPSPTTHIVVGTTLSGLAAIRLLLRLVFGVPPEPLGAPKFFRILARLGQWVFYLLFFLMPLTGYFALYHASELARVLHGDILQPLFWALICVHVSLAFAHQYIWKTDMLGKIIRG